MAKKFLWAYNQQALKSEDGNFYFAIPDPSIYADPSTYGFSFIGETKKFLVYPTQGNDDWNVYSKPAWVTTGFSSGGFDASVNANNTGSSRYGSISLNLPKLGTGTHYNIDVGQGYTTPSMSVSPNSYQFNGNGESKQFIVTSNVPWDVSTNPAWISISSKSGQTGNGSFYAYASQNLSSYRSGYIVMKCTTYPDLYPAGYSIFVDQYPGRTLTPIYNSIQVYTAAWDSDSGMMCYPNYGVYTFYFNVVVSGTPDSWYCTWSPNNGELYIYPTSYSGTYNNAFMYSNYLEYDGYLTFYWSNDNTVAYQMYVSAGSGAC